MTISSFSHWSDGRGSPFTSAGISMHDPFFTMMALLLKNFRMVITGATVDRQHVVNCILLVVYCFKIKCII